ncbi:hypothetical protein GX586_11420 [bacterium]|nr:hypothetical protein [bacterium]
MRRFFSDDSFWNTPISPAAETDPRSSHMIELLKRDGDKGLPFWFNIREWTIPVYEVDGNTPRRTVNEIVVDREKMMARRWGPRSKWFSHGPGFGQNVPIPDHAIPDPAGDHHMAMVDWQARMAWDMWMCRRRADGEWESYTGMVYSLDSTGVWKTSDFAVKDGESIHFHGPGRAAGVPIIAGLFLYDEIMAGEIRHKLAYATFHNAHKQFVPPAAWTDGHRDDGIPEGAVIQLDPALSPDAFNLSRAGRIIFRALQVYGMVNVDNAGGNSIYGEGLYGQKGRSWEGVLDPFEFRRIPLDCYRVLKLENVVHMGDSRNEGAE